MIKTQSIWLFIFSLVCLTVTDCLAISPEGPFVKNTEGDPRISLGVSLKGGICYSMIYTKDLYFDEKSWSYKYFPNAGLGLIADFPISRRTRIWLNPQVMMIDIKEPYLSTDLTFQAFLSKSFFITIGGIVSFEKFKNVGIGPTLGMGFRFAKIVSIYAQSEASYYNLPESGEFVKYRRIQAPISLGVRIDFISAFKKDKSETSVITPPAEKPKPLPAKPVEELKTDQQQQVPVKPAGQPVVTPQPQPPVKPVEEPKAVVLPKSDLSKMSVDELNTLQQNAIKAENFQEADRIQDELNKRIPGAEFKGRPYSDLTTLLNKAIQSEDYVRAQIIQDEITRRETSGVLTDIPLTRLEKMLQEAAKAEDYTRAAAIQEEIKKRKK